LEIFGQAKRKAKGKSKKAKVRIGRRAAFTLD
jgi:hypothetical protein